MKSGRIVAVLLSVTLVAVPCGFGAAPAFDSAGDAAYDLAGGGWVAGDSGGFGFLPWVMPAGSFGTFFIFTGSAVGNGDGVDDGLTFGAPPGIPGDGDINVPSSEGPRSWGLLADPTGGASLAEAIRPFAGPPLSPGETFTIEMDNGTALAGSAAGFGLSSAGTARFEFFATAGGYFVMDGTGFTPAPVPFTTEGLSIAFTLVTLDTYMVSVTPYGAAPIVSPVLPLGGVSGSGIDAVRIFDFGSGPGGGPADIFFNSMSIIPEPATATLVGLALLGALALRRRAG
jgi:hypothetical protein